MNWNVIFAIFKRNFTAYFSNPTGYVFICLYVLLSGIAAFWPNEFFNANLANLDQLNRYLPYIMLIFIPAITMSVWADERRQGTDELLLTIPASDFDVVIGKYLAAVAIFTVALAFSLFNVVILRFLGDPDVGLLLGTYVGYWLVGLAMLAVGMVASFLTSNLTVGFILGVVFNSPLVFVSSAEVLSGLLGTERALALKRWSIAEQFSDFGRGVVSVSGVLYFLGVVVVMLYLSMVLISRRHWQRGREGQSLVGHFLVRAVALVLFMAAIVTLMTRRDVRVDVSSEKLSSLSAETQRLVAEIDPQRPVRIEAFISPQVPESYVPTRLNLLTTLRELEALGRGKIRVRVNDTAPLSAQAGRAETQFGIKGQQVYTRDRGAMKVEDIFLGLAFSSGLEKVVVPFLDRGMPVEYELIRSIATVSQDKRRRVGVLTTDAKLYGGFDMSNMSTSPNEQIINELEKQFEVVQVSADAPLKERYDVLLAVQPSSLTQPQMDNFIAAVKGGQPTAIFEDPFPYVDSRVPGTSAPKLPAGGGGMPFMMNQGPPQPKGDIQPLWNLLGVGFAPQEVVWQAYNPYPKVQQFPSEFVFVDDGEEGQDEPFERRNAISSGLQQVLFLFPGYVRQSNVSGLEFTPLVRTGTKTGVVEFGEILDQGMFGQGGGLNEQRRKRPTREAYVLAAHIKGKLRETVFEMSDEGSPAAGESSAATSAAEPTTTGADATPSAEATTAAESGPTAAAPAETPSAPAEPTEAAAVLSEGAAAESAGAGATPPAGEAASDKPAERPEINVVIVPDIDLLYSVFFTLRSRGDDPENEVNLAVDNVTFVLNVLDVLAGDDRFVEIRKRRPKHKVLTAIEEATEGAKDQANAARDQFVDKFNADRDKEQAQLDAEVEKLRTDEKMDAREKMQKLQTLQEVGQRRLEARVEQFKKERDRQIQAIERDLAKKVSSVQDQWKLIAVAFPPILPLLMGAMVFWSRRAREKEGVSRARLR